MSTVPLPLVSGQPYARRNGSAVTFLTSPAQALANVGEGSIPDIAHYVRTGNVLNKSPHPLDIVGLAPKPRASMKGVAETMADNSRARTDANLRAAIEAARDAVAMAERALTHNPDNASHRITGVLHALSAGNANAMSSVQSAIAANEDDHAATLQAAKEAARQ